MEHDLFQPWLMRLQMVVGPGLLQTAASVRPFAPAEVFVVDGTVTGKTMGARTWIRMKGDEMSFSDVFCSFFTQIPPNKQF